MTLALIRSELQAIPDISDPYREIFNKTSEVSRNQLSDDSNFEEIYGAMYALFRMQDLPSESRSLAPINTACRVMKPYIDLKEDFYFI